MQLIKALRLAGAATILLAGATEKSAMAQGAKPRVAEAPMQHEKSADMDVIHHIFANTSSIRRVVKRVPKGVETTTESDDPKIVDLIQRHTKAMQQRLKDRRPIRAWDPLFAALFQHTDTMQLNATNTRKGVKVTETSDDPNTVKIIQAHAAAVSDFVHDGVAGMAKRHEDPLKKASALAHKALSLKKGDGVTTCPVTGEPVDKKFNAVIKGRTLYFCCGSCVAVVKKNPARYLPENPLNRKHD